MKKQQILVAGTGVLLLLVLYFFGNTVPPRKTSDAATGGQASGSAVKAIGLQDILQSSEARLTPAQLSYVNRLKQSVVRGDVKAQRLNADRTLALFWRDSVSDGLLPYMYYNAEAAKLENTEKSLTFAARLFLESVRGEDDQALKSWMAANAKDLFEKALALNPNNDSTKVGLGASYIFGAPADNPTEVMQGIQRILEVAGRDSSNMYAQFMLGVGGIESGQYDRATGRLETVIRHQPRNVEALLLLAGAYQQQGKKAEAIRCYTAARKLVGAHDMIQAIDKQIQSLQ